jgi:hypothetical protein
MTKTIARALALFSLAAATAAQQPYGLGSAGSGGFVPTLSAPAARLGNPAFSFDLQAAAPNSTALAVLALAPTNLRLLGVDVLVDPAATLLTLGATTSVGPPGSGRASFGLPLPANTSLRGLPLFTQAFVLDQGVPNLLAASRGLRTPLAGAPRVFVACSIAANDPFQLVDPIAGAVLDSGSPPQTDNVSGAAFDAAGRRVFVVSSIRGTFSVGDLTNTPTSWSTLWTVPGGTAYGLGTDLARQLAWTLAPVTTSGSRELVAIDIDANSATYGQTRHNTVNMLSGQAEIFDLAPSGNVAAVLTYLPNSLTIVDTNPQSATFLQNRVTQVAIPVDQAGAISLATRIAITPDERYALITIQGQGATPAEIARFDLTTLAFVDHNGAAPGQNIGPLSQPPILMGSAPTTLLVASHGRFAIVGGFGGCGWVGRLDLDPRDPTSLAFTPFTSTLPLQNGWTSGLSTDETEIAVATWPRSGCSGAASPELVRLDVATGVQLGAIGIPANSNGSNQNLYTVVYY